ncbi:hypothetical protein AGDE_01546 [Angomonas deanei]|uniref:CRAL/TRIO domain containing protein, putative n=1 Tax=Angomonas deanei TaxID=59799 RepID=A0A7G2C5K3_9TRYP|nr:hypothetical protein AGDE_01546 [Angomonas deanei]CAD2214033.1 CRAL/TRIO domain containing protein, putative [Angomonas deanei]|eukprot:EPY42377.1 hypothetical protein AGDE_01546 [Angomonas deanei]
MSSSYTSLEDLGEVALSHKSEVEEVKRSIGIQHGYFDAWIYGFLENKKFNIEETVAKLHRRFAMEISELAVHEENDFMYESLRKGIIQDIGNDKDGRVAFYINTKRDFPESKHREEQRRTFDMFVSYGTRLRKENKRCQLVMLINQDGASMFKNVDMAFQADVALRISKFYPGMVDKMYICKMGRTLAAMAKPVFRTLPAIVSDRIKIIDEKDIKEGELLKYFDASVLPVDLGGTNDCDTPSHWEDYARRVETYYGGLKDAVGNQGLTVKEWELQELGVDIGRKSKNPSFANSLNSISFDSFMANSFAEGPLQTCISEDFDARSGMEPYPNVVGMTWTEIMEPFPHSLAVFFLDELVRWREAIEEEEQIDRQKIVQGRDAGLSEVNKTTVTDQMVRKEKVRAACCSCTH